MKISLKGKSLIKKIALALAGVAAITTVAFGVKAIVDYTKNDLKKISPSFEVGNLGSDGKFVDDESTLYTKEAFVCDGLQVKLDFDNQINYQIFYYDDLDNFIESTNVLSESYSGGAHDGYARVVIIPTNDEDGKISWTEKVSYPRQMTVKVNKSQNIEYVNVLNRRMLVVDNVLSMRFVSGGVEQIANKYVFVDDGEYCVTSKDVIMIKSGGQLTFDSSYLSITDLSDISFNVYELRYVNGLFEVLKVNSRVTTLDFDKNTTHAFFTCRVGSSGVDFNEINRCITITKTK